MKKPTLNDADREQWIENDEGLYNWGADVVVLERPTRIERETLTRDLLPGGVVIEVDEAAGRFHRPAGCARRRRHVSE